MPHQFGNFTILGDGRALLLGEHVNNKQRFDIQLNQVLVTLHIQEMEMEKQRCR